MQFNSSGILFLEQILRYREACEEKTAEIDSLKRRLKSRELEVSHVREEETQRARMLQMAVQSPFQTVYFSCFFFTCFSVS
jgi:hypothetical protein